MPRFIIAVSSLEITDHPSEDFKTLMELEEKPTKGDTIVITDEGDIATVDWVEHDPRAKLDSRPTMTVIADCSHDAVEALLKDPKWIRPHEQFS